MQNIFTNSKLVWGVAVGFWILVFLVSSVFVNPETHTPYMSNYLFHVIMFVISTVLVYLCFKYFQMKNVFNLPAVYTFLLVNILLDWIVLIGLIKFSVSEWFLWVLPAYLVGTVLVYKIVNK